MVANSYIFLEVEPGKEKEVRESIFKLDHPHSQIMQVDIVSGPYDLVVIVQGDHEQVENTTLDDLHTIQGVLNTTTCLGIELL